MTSHTKIYTNPVCVIVPNAEDSGVEKDQDWKADVYNPSVIWSWFHESRLFFILFNWSDLMARILSTPVHFQCYDTLPDHTTSMFRMTENIYYVSKRFLCAGRWCWSHEISICGMGVLPGSLFHWHSDDDDLIEEWIENFLLWIRRSPGTQIDVRHPLRTSIDEYFNENQDPRILLIYQYLVMSCVFNFRLLL